MHCHSETTPDDSHVYYVNSKSGSFQEHDHEQDLKVVDDELEYVDMGNMISLALLIQSLLLL